MTGFPTWTWIIFGGVVLALLAVDLMMHRGDHPDSRRRALIWSIIWISAGLLFNVFVLIAFGPGLAEEYLAAYLTEESLSLDNLFLFLVIFESLRIPRANQHNVLFWGIIGVLVFRGLFILLGAAALDRWAWVSFVFGAILFFAAYRTFRGEPGKEEESKLIRWLATHLPVTMKMHGNRFLVQENGRWMATRLLLALIAIELTDIMFAIDSVAAALSMTRSRFVLYTANIFAVLGLRALYLLLAQSIADLYYLRYGIGVILTFAAFKLTVGHWFTIAPLTSIAVIVLVISVTIWLSVRHARRHPRPAAPPPVEPAESPPVARGL